MLPAQKKKSLAALKRIDGLSKKLATMLEEDTYCPKLLEMALAMQGHVKYIQGQVLESHLHTCAEKKLSSPRHKKEFIKELLKAIGLSSR